MFKCFQAQISWHLFLLFHKILDIILDKPNKEVIKVSLFIKVDTADINLTSKIMVQEQIFKINNNEVKELSLKEIILVLIIQINILVELEMVLVFSIHKEIKSVLPVKEDINNKEIYQLVMEIITIHKKVDNMFQDVDIMYKNLASITLLKANIIQDKVNMFKGKASIFLVKVNIFLGKVNMSQAKANTLEDKTELRLVKDNI